MRPQIVSDVYCGSPPLPGDLWSSWNFDPWLLGALAIAAFLRVRYQPDGRGLGAFTFGMAALVVAFVSPLCALSSGLFSARSMHHLLLVVVAAPLIAHGAVRLRGLPLPLMAALHIAIFLGWHLPVAYQWALSGHVPYWIMQASLLASAILFWTALYNERSGAVAILWAFAVIVQMGLLGALLTFAPEPLYAPHFTTTAIYGLAPLEDQQLAGLLMWVVSLPLAALASLPALRLSIRNARQMVPAQ